MDRHEPPNVEVSRSPGATDTYDNRTNAARRGFRLDRRVRPATQRKPRMKLSPPWTKTGLCHVCGKPTQLLIHAPCGLKCDEAKKAKVPGMGSLTVQHTANGRHNANKKKWAAGKLPPWMA